MQLVVDSYGAFLGKTSERLVVRIKDEQPTEVPLDDVEQVMITSKGVTLSTDAIRECMERGVIINLVTSTGKPYGSIVPSSLSATVATVREQMRAYDDDRGAALARAFVTGKIRNAAAVLRYFAKHRRQSAGMHAVLMEKSAAIEKILGEIDAVTGDRVDGVRGVLLSIEGRAANVYWEGVQAILAPRVAFPGREHRGATDPVNAMLNYGYGILQTQVEDALMRSGLNCFGGYLHVDRPGKPSLTLDLMEEFRHQVVDRVVVSLLGRGFSPEMADGMLTRETSRAVADAVLERLESLERYHGKKHRLRSIIHSQAHRLASFLRGEGAYRPFVGSW